MKRGFDRRACSRPALPPLAAQAGAAEVRVPVSLTSFGAAQAISSYQLSAAALALRRPDLFASNPFAGDADGMPVRSAAPCCRRVSPPSTALNINLALDGGYNLDLAQRFDNYDALAIAAARSRRVFWAWPMAAVMPASPMMPTPDLRLRLGAQVKSDRLDSFTFDPTARHAGLPLAYDTWRVSARFWPACPGI